MAKLNDISGVEFGHWTVLYRNGSTANKAAVWHCKCNLCGSESDVVGSSLISGASTKCRSCVPRETLTKPHRNERIYHIYTAMKQRCTNPKHSHYASYGGRGISVCKEWIDNPDKFIEWAFANGYSRNLTIERVDLNGNYEPSNCKWIPLVEQQKNRRTSRFVVYKGEKMTFTDACRSAGLSRSAVESYRKRHSVDHQTAIDHYI